MKNNNRRMGLNRGRIIHKNGQTVVCLVGFLPSSPFNCPIRMSTAAAAHDFDIVREPEEVHDIDDALEHDAPPPDGVGYLGWTKLKVERWLSIEASQMVVDRQPAPVRDELPQSSDECRSSADYDGLGDSSASSSLDEAMPRSASLPTVLSVKNWMY